MWIFLSDCCVSVVAHRSLPGLVLVRSRIRGDVERLLPSVTAEESETADYRFRAVVPAKDVAEAIGRRILEMDYPNFKASVGEAERSAAYHAVYGELVRRYGAYGGEPAGQRFMRRPTTGDADVDRFLFEE